MTTTDSVITQSMAMRYSPRWRLDNGHCIRCGLKCFEVIMIPPEKTSDYSQNEMKISSNRVSMQRQKVPITNYDDGVVDGYCTKCDCGDDELDQKSSLTTGNSHHSIKMEREDKEPSPSQEPLKKTITTAKTDDGLLNLKRMNDGSGNFVVVGPGGIRSQSSSFVPPERVAKPAPTEKAIAGEASYQHMPSLILSTRQSESMNTGAGVIDASAPVIGHDHHSSSSEIVFPEGIYTGELSVQGNPEGLGSMQFHDGSVYKGNWVNGRMHGKGTCSYTDGGQFSGEWKRGQMHGTGIFKFGNGCSYEGSWRSGKMDGKGKYSFFNGECYNGEWKRNHPEGHGTFAYVSGNRYEGSWSKGKKDGNGTFRYVNGDVYVGEWRADLKHGVGLYRWSSNSERLAGCLDIKTYFEDEPQDGIRWNPSKTQVWKIQDGATDEISLAEAYQFKEQASAISPFLFMALLEDF